MIVAHAVPMWQPFALVLLVALLVAVPAIVLTRTYP
jgi:hypothetical protein